MKRSISVTLVSLAVWVFFCICALYLAPAQDKEVPPVVQEMSPPAVQKENEVAGEIFGVPVPMSNYYFAKKAVATFGARWRTSPKTQEELEDLVWQELIFSYEAFKRGIEASEEEIDEEIKKILKSEKAEFDYKESPEKFEAWCKEKLNMTPQFLRHQMAHLIKLEKLRVEILESFDPPVTEEEAYQKFLDEYNTLAVELRRFDDKSEADVFYKEVTAPLKEGAQGRLIWRDLVLSYEASKRKIEPSDELVDWLIESLLRQYEVHFQWKKDEEKFTSWIKEKFGISKKLFYERMQRLAQIDSLMQKIYTGEEPRVDFGKNYNAYLAQYGSVAAAYEAFAKSFPGARKKAFLFKTFEEAKAFYKQVKRAPGVWEERKRKEPKEFKQPGFVALDFLINMWKYQRDDAYAMLKMQPGEFYKPAPIYKGFAVSKILKIRPAELSQFEERKKYYFDRVKQIKKYDAYKEWVEEFKKKANIKIYIGTNQ